MSRGTPYCLPGSGWAQKPGLGPGLDGSGSSNSKPGPEPKPDQGSGQARAKARACGCGIREVIEGDAAHAYNLLIQEVVLSQSLSKMRIKYLMRRLDGLKNHLMHRLEVVSQGSDKSAMMKFLEAATRTDTACSP
ncbi:hypothetical protein JB92DRAFT_2831983 [Gautieria morchelliformis]|nr:hypothetical protein JB92DRAFT_2831983 [Gautieria morchelliformis]